jgi:hypothetical protein
MWNVHLNSWVFCKTVILQKKFCEELIAYFTLVRHGLHRKRRLQQLFLAAGTSLPSYYLSATEIDKPTDARVKTFFCSCVYIRSYGSAFLKPLPSNDRKDTHTDTETDGRDIWSMPFWLAQLPWYTVYISFIIIGSSIRKLLGEIHRYGHTESMEMA